MISLFLTCSFLKISDCQSLAIFNINWVPTWPVKHVNLWKNIYFMKWMMRIQPLQGRNYRGGAGGAAAPPGPLEPDKWSLWIEDFPYSNDLFSLDSDILIVVTSSCLPFSWPGNRLVHGVCKPSQHSAKFLRFFSPHQSVEFRVKDPSLLCVVWSYGHVLQWQKNALAALQWCLFIVKPTTCQRQRIFMNENQTEGIFYRLFTQTSCSTRCFKLTEHRK